MKINRNHRILLTALAVVLLAMILPVKAVLAAPVAPDPVPFTQPDGTVLVSVPFGDEYYSGYEYEGFTILLDSVSGYWMYAQPDKSGRLSPGPLKAGIDAPPFGEAPHLRDSLASQAKLPSGVPPLGPQVWPGATGNHKLVTLLVDFTPSTSRGTTDAQWNALFFDAAPGAKSVGNFYKQASFGNFGLAPADETYGVANDGVIAVTLGYAHPNSYPSNDNNRLISKNAMIAADPYINFGSLDTNGNGSLDVTELHLMVIVRGFEKSYGGTSGSCAPGVWGHRGSLSTTTGVTAPVLDGVTVGASAYAGGYTQEGEWHQFNNHDCNVTTWGHMATMGIMVHELGHDIDWPDLYDIDYTSAGVGDWSIMSGGSWGQASGSEFSGSTPVLPDAFLKWYQHWITPVAVTIPQAGVALANSAQNPTAYLLGVNPGNVDWDSNVSTGVGEYFLVENRQLVGFDAGLWGIDSAGNAHGCLIYHVDETRVATNSANADETRRMVDVEEADGPPQDMDAANGVSDAGDPWPGSSSDTAFNAASDPNTNWYDGSASGIAVTNISTGGTGCTLDFTGVGPAWSGGVSSSWNNPANWTVGRLPNQYDNIVIPAGVPNWPDVNAAASAGNLNILSGAHLNATAGAALVVYGNWSETGSGSFNPTAGTVVFRGSFAQSIAASPASHFQNLQIGSGATLQTVTAASDLDVNGDLTVMPGAKLDTGSHTLHVGGNWTDAPFGFAPGSGTVILDGAGQTVQKAGSETVAYSSDFTSTTGWSTYDANAGGSWSYSTSVAAPNLPAPGTGMHARYFLSSTIAADDWLFSPGFSLEAGRTYTVRFNYGAYNASKPEKLDVKIGAAQTVSAMSTQLFNNSNVINLTWQQGSGVYTPVATGVYYLGFHCYSAANMGYPGIDDVTVTATDSNLAFYNLSVAGAASLADDAAVQNNLSINAGGSLALGTYNLTVEGALANNGALSQVKTVNASNVLFLNLKNLAGSVDKYLGAAIDPGSANMGGITVTVWGGQRCPGAGRGILRCFDIAPATAQPAAVTFYFTEAERSGLDLASLSVHHWNGSAWNQEPGTTTRGGSGDGQWVQVTGVAAYSPFALNNSSPTAVNLAWFNGQALSPGVSMLKWETVNEANLAGFNLYRAESEAADPERINANLIPCQWPGSGPGGSYAYQDETAAPGRTYYYWIELIDAYGIAVRIGPVRVAAMPAGGYNTYIPLVTAVQ